MKIANSDEGIRERLIIAGIKEIELHGLTDFSLRRVASACEVSCAAPYRHYKNKDELVLAIIAYINSRWDMMSEQIEKTFEGDTARQLIEVCTANVRFLIANPNYLSIMLPVQSGMTEEQQSERARIWARIKNLAEKYATERNATDDGRAELAFLLQTLIYGTVMLLEGLSAAECEQKIIIMRKELERIVGGI
ncbi:MAG: TetR/AcrR family transcriptional regulator [Clostridia bacterium]|nr:TetR/AcrR family transcriptional regulator [Clostridia bacterium]